VKALVGNKSLEKRKTKYDTVYDSSSQFARHGENDGDGAQVPGPIARSQLKGKRLKETR